MKTKRLVIRLLPFFLLLVNTQIGLSQEGEMGIYPVEPIYAPPLKRPPIAVNQKLLPEGTTGRFPTHDGQYFHLNLKEAKEIKASQEDAYKLLETVLRALNWEQKRELLKARKPMPRPATDEAKLDAYINDASEKTQEMLKGRFGEINQATKEAIQEQERLARQQATQKSIIFRYDQYYGDVPIDETYLKLVWKQEEGFTAVTGRVFNIIKVLNRQVLTAEQAQKAAIQYVTRRTKIHEKIEMKPQLVLLPYADQFRYCWKVVAASYQVWIDAQTGKVLQLLPMFASDDATGLIFDPDPDGNTREVSFVIDPPSNGSYRLELSGVLEVTNNGADGVCSGDLTIADNGTGTANFNVSPINGTIVERTNSTGYNCRFQDVNAYAWIYRHIQTFTLLLGSASLPAIRVTVNHGNPCGFGIDNACANWGTFSLTFGIGNATISTSTSCNDLFNSALDASVLTHEFGHLINHQNNSGTIPQHVDEGLADFWAYTALDTNTFGSHWASNCATHHQGGYVPRRVEGQDVFPEHRNLSTSGYGDGQILGWGLWNVRREFNEATMLGTFLINSNLLDAHNLASYANGTSAQQVHNNFLELLEKLATQFKNSWNVHKVLSGFARAGIFLSPRDAVIDIDDDYLNRNDVAGPTFTVWTGRDYTFNTNGSVNTTNPPFNTRFEIEVANNATFTMNLVSSGVQSGVIAGAGGTATWALPTANWNTLKGQNHLYYRVHTRDASGGYQRTSSNPGNGFLTNVPTAYAVINETGECECTCGASANTTKVAVFVTLLPILFGIVWMLRVKNRKM